MPRFKAPVAPGEGYKPEIKLVWTPHSPLGRGGLNTSVPPSELRQDEAHELVNWRVDRNGIKLGDGYIEIDDAITDTDKIIWITTQDIGTGHLIRVTSDYLYDLASDMEFDKITVSGPAAMAFGFLSDYTWIQSKLVVCGSIDKPHYYSLGNDLVEITEATAGIYICANYADRLFLANVWAAIGTRTYIEWSISGDITDFDGTGSGNVTLEDSPEGSDDIRAMTVHADTLVIYRQASIWHGTRTAVPEPPVRFASAVSALGKVPQYWGRPNIVSIPDVGDIYVGKDNVYLYHPADRAPTPIGGPVRDDFPWSPASGSAQFDLAYNAHEGKVYFYCLTTSEMFTFDVQKYIDTRFGDAPELVWCKTTTGVIDNVRSMTTGAAILGQQSEGLGALYKPVIFSDSIGQTFYLDEATLSLAGVTDGMTAVYESPAFFLPGQKIQLSRLSLKYIADTNTTNITVATSVDGGRSYTGDRAVALDAGNKGDLAEEIIWVRSAFGQSVMFKITQVNSQVNSTGNGKATLVSYSLGLLPRGPTQSRA